MVTLPGSYVLSRPAPSGGGWPDAVAVRRSGEDRDIIRISFDPTAKIIRACASGCWSLDETKLYLAGLETFLRSSRGRLGKARVLLDRRDVSAQAPEVAAMLASANGRIFEREDKIAMVVSSSLAKVDLRQRMPHPGSKAFLSADAAETWLRAFECPNERAPRPSPSDGSDRTGR
jgi:hypothetical protein